MVAVDVKEIRQETGREAASFSIEMGENAVSIEIRVVLAFGCHIPEIAKNIQDTVIDEITRITGMQVPRIDVVVMDLEDPEEEESDSDSDSK